MADLARLKTALRISHDKLNEEIQYNVDACKKDMMRVGITVINEEDSAIQKVFELYLKWQYDFMGEGERYEKAYKGMRNGLSLCGEYEEREVFAEELPINQSEFFKCRETGLRPALCLRIPYGEYEQEEVLRFRGRLYSVYRFRNDFHHTELYCEARSGLQ